ncbi:hypothetical protein PSEUDO8BK_30803 [Pseudomonas sp. 8BK]|nr:hypothetical protein PSEUDO8BK_30803 [Pseudomonas sp. 8BK]
MSLSGNTTKNKQSNCLLVLFLQQVKIISHNPPT